MKEAYDHHRVTPEGQLLGEQMAKMYGLAARQLGDNPHMDERCKTCAFRAGTVPNGCAQTQLDISKCAADNIPFYCHQHRGQLCDGWVMVRAAFGEILPRLAGTKHDYPLSPPDSQRHIVDAAEAKRARKAAKLRRLAARGAIKEVLPEGLWRNAAGALMYGCRSCGAATEWPAKAEDFEIDNRANVCGRSPRCCP